MPFFYSLKKFSLSLAVFSLFSPLAIGNNALLSAEKFIKNQRGERILLTKAGVDFANTIASQQITGKINKIPKQEAYKWLDRFVKLSNKQAQKKEDFTPVNNFLNHLKLCDELFAEIYAPQGAEAKALKALQEIPPKRKEMLMRELEKLREEIRADTRELVETNHQKAFQKITALYDLALKETLDIQ
jgi:hypothetical protein